MKQGTIEIKRGKETAKQPWREKMIQKCLKMAKQWVSARVNGNNSKSYKIIWSKTKIKEYWKECFKDIYGNASDISKNRLDRNVVDVILQEKLVKRK